MSFFMFHFKKRFLFVSVFWFLTIVALQAIAIETHPESTIVGGPSSGTHTLHTMDRDREASPPEHLLDTLKRSRYQFFLLVLEEGATLVWRELSPGLEFAIEHDTRRRISVNPVFAFNFEFLSQVMNEDTFARYQISNLSQILVLSQKRNFKLTHETLQKLREQGVSEEVLKNLNIFNNQEFTTEDEFGNAIEEQLGEEQFIHYKDLIFIVSDQSSNMSLVNPENTNSKDNTSLNQKVNIESWNTIMFYSRKVNNALAAKNEKKSKPKTKSYFDEDAPFFDLIQFFKEWGVPTPLVIILCILGAYLLLSLLTRGR